MTLPTPPPDVNDKRNPIPNHLILNRWQSRLGSTESRERISTAPSALLSPTQELSNESYIDCSTELTSVPCHSESSSLLF